MADPFYAKKNWTINTSFFERHSAAEWVTWIARVLAIALGALHAISAARSYSMNPDGINYLDMGEAYLRGDWNMALNSVWSPLYSWILGISMQVFRPSMQAEFPLVHLINFLIYLFTFFCFEAFWRSLYQLRLVIRAEGRIGLPEWAWLGIGYALFVWASLSLIEIWAVTPDMLMAALVFLAAYLVVRIQRGSDSYWMYLLLGIVLGIGYLGKAIMLPISLVFLAASAFAAGPLRKGAPRALVGLAAFFLIAVPFIAAVSAAKGRISINDAGSYTFIRHVNGIPYPHWQGQPPEFGVPLHPSRQIYTDPPVYEFATPIGGTYPISYDPVYWYAGAVPQYEPMQLAIYLIRNLLVYYDMFFRQQAALVIGFLALLLLGNKSFTRINKILPNYILLFPALAAFLLYALVLIEGRYVGVFIVLFWAALLSNISVTDNPIHRSFLNILPGLIILVMLGNIFVFNLEGFVALERKAETRSGSSNLPPSWPGEIAEELHELGIHPGDQVGVIGYAFDSYWARLARVKIVAEMLEWDAIPFWTGSPDMREGVVGAFQSTGAHAIVAERVPAYASVEDWHQVENSNYYIYVLGPENATIK